MKKSILLFFISSILFTQSCKNKTAEATANTSDSTTTVVDTSAPISVSEQQPTQVDPNIKSDESADLGNSVNTFFKAIADNDLSEAAKHCAYMGNDKKRFHAEAFNIANAEEKEIVKITSNTIKDWIKKSGNNYQLKALYIDNKEGKKWYTQEIDFNYGSSVEKKYFSFLKVGDAFLLGDIDSEYTKSK